MIEVGRKVVILNNDNQDCKHNFRINSTCLVAFVMDEINRVELLGIINDDFYYQIVDISCIELTELPIATKDYDQEIIRKYRNV